MMGHDKMADVVHDQAAGRLRLMLIRTSRIVRVLRGRRSCGCRHECGLFLPGGGITGAAEVPRSVAAALVGRTIL